MKSFEIIIAALNKLSPIIPVEKWEFYFFELGSLSIFGR